MNESPLIFSFPELDIPCTLQAKFTVLGNPVRHSLSPPMHNAALEKLAKDARQFANWRYIGIEVAVEHLSGVLNELWERKFLGINLTIPHKVEVMKLVSERDETAEAIGAINTLKWTEKGWKGFNTDAYGITHAVREELKLSMKDRDVLLLGAGGASRAIAVAAIDAGCRRLTILNRTQDRLDDLIQHLKSFPGYQNKELRGGLFQSLPDDFEEGLLIINATSLGLKKSDPAPVDLSKISVGNIAVYDTTYGSENQLRMDCLNRGIPYSDGLSMLVWQGAKSLSIWTESEVCEKTMTMAVRAELQRRKERAG